METESERASAEAIGGLREFFDQSRRMFSVVISLVLILALRRRHRRLDVKRSATQIAD